MAVAEKNEAQTTDNVIEDKAETERNDASAKAAKMASATDMSNIFDRIAEDIQTWAVRANPINLAEELELTNWSSPASLRKQQKRALDVLGGSGLLGDKTQKDSLHDEPQFDHLEKDRSK